MGYLLDYEFHEVVEIIRNDNKTTIEISLRKAGKNLEEGERIRLKKYMNSLLMTQFYRG